MQTDSVASDVTSDGGLTVLAVDTSTDMLACAVARIAAQADGAHGVDVLASGDHLCRRHANEQLVNTALTACHRRALRWATWTPCSWAGVRGRSRACA
jgi:N6-L-threonylcarbamoyladenine synthase